MNAAPLYRKCFEQLPTTDFLAVSAHLDGETSPSEVNRLIERSADALALLHEASRIEECDWGIEYLRDITSFDFSPARCVARLAVFRADRAFREDRHLAGLDDLLAVMTFGRHLGRGPYISGLSASPIEGMAVTKAFEIIDQLDPETRQAFAERLGALPQFQTFAETLRAEKLAFKYLYREPFAQLDETNFESALRQRFGFSEDVDRDDPMIAALLPEQDPADEMFQAAGGTRAGLIALADDVLSMFDFLIKATEGHSLGRMDQFDEQAATNPLLRREFESFKTMKPIWGQFDKRFTRLYHQAGRAGASDQDSLIPPDGRN